MIFVVPEAKVVSYLLSDRGKGGFFRRFGYGLENWTRLRYDLLLIAQNNHMTFVREVDFGRKYQIIGEIVAPDGRAIKLRTGWILAREDLETLRFVTAYPVRSP